MPLTLFYLAYTFLKAEGFTTNLNMEGSTTKTVHRIVLQKAVQN